MLVKQTLFKGRDKILAGEAKFYPGERFEFTWVGASTPGDFLFEIVELLGDSNSPQHSPP